MGQNARALLAAAAVAQGWFTKEDAAAEKMLAWTERTIKVSRGAPVEHTFSLMLAAALLLASLQMLQTLFQAPDVASEEHL